MEVVLVQQDILWEQPEENLSQLNTLLAQVNTADSIVLPEMFTTGFSMRTEAGVAHTSAAVEWMQSIASSRNCAITGSLMTEESGLYYNRMYFVHPDGAIEHYDKRHLFTLAGEQETYTPGVSPVVVTYKGVRILLQVCYDLRFPVFSRNTQNYDVIIYVANWPVPRIQAWDTLLQARAIENMAYCIGVNRVGTDGTGMDYCGHSAMYDMLGNEVIDKMKSEGIARGKIDVEKIKRTRKMLNFLNDRDHFKLQN